MRTIEPTSREPKTYTQMLKLLAKRLIQTRLKELQSLSADGSIKSYPQKFIPRLHPQSSSPEFSPSSVLGPGTCFKAYNLIQSQDAWLERKNECYKKLVKKFSSLPPSLLLTTRSAELKLSALKKWVLLEQHFFEMNFHDLMHVPTLCRLSSSFLLHLILPIRVFIKCLLVITNTTGGSLPRSSASCMLHVINFGFKKALFQEITVALKLYNAT